jgi:hypothetical protein
MPTVQELIAYMVGDNLDKLITLDLRGQGMVKPIYDVARRDAGMPLTLNAAQRLHRCLSGGQLVVLCTGFPGYQGDSVPKVQDTDAIRFSGELSPGRVRGETDGLVATAAFARAVDLGYGAKPVVVTEAEIVPVISAALQAAGLRTFTRADTIFDEPHSVAILDFPKEDSDAQTRTRELLSFLHPVCVISIERPGRNSSGEYHMSNGLPITPFVAKIDHLYTAVRDAGVLTIGIGDLGNELGLGTLQDACRQFAKFGAQCRCPCNRGIACTVKSDVTVIGGISDNVAHGVIAALAYLRGRPDLLPDPRLEERLLEAVASKGAEDGSTGFILPWIDGVRSDYHTRLVDQMRDIITYPHFFLELQQSSYHWVVDHASTWPWA